LRREIERRSSKPERVRLRGATSLTAGTPSAGTGKVRNFTAQFRGRSSLTVVAPSIFLAWPSSSRSSRAALRKKKSPPSPGFGEESKAVPFEKRSLGRCASRFKSRGPPYAVLACGIFDFSSIFFLPPLFLKFRRLLELFLKIEMVVVPASRIEGGSADRAARLALHVFANRQPCAACPTQNCFLIPFAPWPNLDGMTCERDMAVFAGVVGRAALHFDGDDVRVLVVVQATRLRIEIQSTDLSSICRRGPARDRSLLFWRRHSMRAYHFCNSLWECVEERSHFHSSFESSTKHTNCPTCAPLCLGCARSLG